MSEKVAYLSQEWRDEVEKRFKAELSPEKMKFITTSVSYIYTGCPDGKDRCLYFKCDNGNFVEVAVEEGPPRQAEFVITGSYDLFSKLTQGIISSQRALMSGKLKVKGNMVKALKLASLADRMNKIMSRIPATY
ncbi:MAG TPA: SCP2 sterol-binding domain-containing protein [Deltaproteobacteria bacterium]|nr:SCP2 sterol-binding domain-containing protein [Deltaproteobacteria bacterium]HQJ07404.1 SCP2 sterol-binding domain-containing protein [Deltaproteobacteria bacterium]